MPEDLNLYDRAEDLKEYTRTNGHELYQFFMSNLDSMESISNVIVMHWNKPHAMAHAIKQQIENDLNREPYDEAQRRIYGEQRRR